MKTGSSQKKGGHEIFTHSPQIFQSLWYIFLQWIWHHYGWKLFCLCVCVCVCVCNALRQNQEVVCAEKNTSILYKLPNLILDCLHLEDGDSKILGNVDSYSHIDKLQSVSQKSCIFTKAVVTSNLVTVTYLQISNLYQRHAKIKIISWTSYLLHSWKFYHYSWAGPGFVESEAYTIYKAPF